jgi:hypothetical protein
LQLPEPYQPVEAEEPRCQETIPECGGAIFCNGNIPAPLVGGDRYPVIIEPLKTRFE